MEKDTHTNTIDDGHLLYSKRRKVALRGQTIEIDGIQPQLEEGIDPVSYALQAARSHYERVMRESLLSENLLILAGAGSSIDVGPVSGLSMEGLWNHVEKESPGDLKKISEVLKYDPAHKNLEALLTRSDQYLNYHERLNPTGTETEEFKFIQTTTVKIKKVILTKCSFANAMAGDGPHFSPHVHSQFLKNISYRKSRLARPKIFTTNYDRAFEVAATESGFIMIDGFSFGSLRTFNGKFFDYDIVMTKNNRVPTEDNFAPNIVHLYKMHGSIDWFKEGEKIVQRESTEQEPLMVFPNQDKFELSYDQPYFEMMSRFQSELRKSGSTTLLVIGFSFGDNHINRIIEEALNHNAFLKVIIVDKFSMPPFAAEQATRHFLERKADHSDQVVFVRESFSDFVKFMPSPNKGIDVFGEMDDPRSKHEN